MRWALEKHLQPLLQPRWLARWQVSRARLGLIPPPSQAFLNSQRTLFVDVSVIARHDAGTGIQRVVRHVALELLNNPPPGWRVVPVGATRKRPYHVIHWPESRPLHEYVLPAKAGDVFLGLDYALDAICLHQGQFKSLRKQGVAIWFVMYDLLPWQHPDWFSDKMVVRYRKWLNVLARYADGFLSISPATNAVLNAVFAGHYLLANGYHSHVVPMGWDFAPATKQGHDCRLAHDVLQHLGNRPTALMVGTIEPRKGHADVLAAFEHLWQHGADCNLLIVGKPGWKTEPFQAALRQHPQHLKHLFWLDKVDDALLACLYQACTGVIAASHAEGFGLPLLEALAHGKPVLARDIPVFHTLQLDGLTYFPATANAVELAGYIQTWLMADHSAVTIPPLPTWRDTAQAIAQTVLQDV